MTDPGRDIGLCLAAFADRTFDEALRAALELELDVVDLPTDSVFAIGRTQPDPDTVRRRVDEAGIRVACVSNSRDTQLLLGPHGPHTDGVVRGAPDQKVEHGRRAACAAIELASELGAPLVRLLLGCPDYGRWFRWPGSEVDWRDNVAAFVEVAAPLADEARRHGVRLCLEPHPKQVAFDASSVVACIDGVRAEGQDVAVCFDPANLAATGHDPVAFLASTGLVPAAVHAKDVEHSPAGGAVGDGWVRYGPQPAVRFRAVPWGDLDWRRIVTRLHDIGFDGPILVEHEDLLVDRRLGIAGARDHLRSLRTGPSPGAAWW